MLMVLPVYASSPKTSAEAVDGILVVKLFGKISLIVLKFLNYCFPSMEGTTQDIPQEYEKANPRPNTIALAPSSINRTP